MTLLTHVWCLFLRQLRNSLRMPSALFLSVFQPLLWLLLFSQLFGSMRYVPGFSHSSYLGFLAPGIAIMTAQYGSAYSGLGTIGDLQFGVMDRFLASPVRRIAILLGPLCYVAAQCFVQAIFILLIAAILGARPAGSVAGNLVLLIASAALGVAIGSLSHGLAIKTKSQQKLITSINFISLPLTFLSSMMMTKTLMPHWIRLISAFNPVDWAVTAARQGFNGTWSPTDWHFWSLLIFVSACIGIATMNFRNYQDNA